MLTTVPRCFDEDGPSLAEGIFLRSARSRPRVHCRSVVAHMKVIGLLDGLLKVRIAGAPLILLRHAARVYAVRPVEACITIWWPFEGCWPLRRPFAATDIWRIAALPLIFLRGAPRHYGVHPVEACKH